MAWTTPKSWIPNELLLASDFNTQFRDNLAYLHDQSYGLMQGTRTTLGGAGATLAVTGIDDDWEVLHIVACMRGAVVATSDTVRLRLGGAVLDTSAPNYYGYNDSVSGTGPTRTVSENLGATAGIFISVFIPGSTATANYFNLFTATIVNGNVQAEEKRGLFKNMFQLANTTGNIGLQHGQGKWINTTNTLQQISFITASGSNLAAGSWVAIFGGNA